MRLIRQGVNITEAVVLAVAAQQLQATATCTVYAFL